MCMRDSLPINHLKQENNLTASTAALIHPCSNTNTYMLMFCREIFVFQGFNSLRYSINKTINNWRSGNEEVTVKYAVYCCYLNLQPSTAVFFLLIRQKAAILNLNGQILLKT